jgi:hypothetical protein
MDELDRDDVLIHVEEPHFVLDPSCPNCGDTGVMEEGSRLLECICVLQQRVTHYLTPTYGTDIPWDPEFPFSRYVGKDVLIENSGQLPAALFRRRALGAVKSYLLLTGRRLSHQTLRPYEVFRRLFATDDAPGFEQLCSGVRLLILSFDGDDPWKKTYPRELPWVLRLRRDHSLATWIISTMPLKSPSFEDRYRGLGEPLSECSADFVRLHLP